MDERYGRGPRKSRPVVTVAVLVSAIFVIWLLVVALQHARPLASTTLISFQVRSDREVSIRYEIGRRDPKTALICTLIARDFQTSIVGEVRDQIGASGARRVAREVSIPTRARAATVMIARCAPITR